jgi:hypothetical protein
MKQTTFILVLLSLWLVSCKNETSLQEFYVDNQNDKQYLAFDIPASVLAGEDSNLTREQKATIETIRKINILGFPKKAKNEAAFEQEQEKLAKILKSDKYNLLMKYGGGDRKAELYYMGKEDAIDEIIVFGSDRDRGFGVARVTGDDMNPEDIIRLLKSFETGKFNLQGLQDLSTMF